MAAFCAKKTAGVDVKPPLRTAWMMPLQEERDRAATQDYSDGSHVRLT
jgi:hypothetical protein